MNNYLNYILQVSFVFAALYTLYFFFLRKLTFHWANRIFLLLLIPVSILIPILNLGLKSPIVRELKIPEFNELLPTIIDSQEPVVDSLNTLYSNNILLFIYGIGVSFFILRFLRNIAKLIHLRKRSASIRKDKFVFIAADIPSPFSCFNWIFLPKNKFNNCEGPILEHEKFHARLWHTFDLMLTEIFIALLWFNPFVFFFRKSIKSIHEFQADEFVLKTNVSKAQYLQLMLNNLEMKRSIDFYSYFNRLTIKNRVKMITINKSQKIQMLKYLILIPVIAFLTMAFAPTGDNIPSIFPIRAGEYSKITNPFGKTFKDPTTQKEMVHGGIDISAKEGVSVLATSEGIIIHAQEKGGWGNLIIIDHGNGYKTWYAHLQGFAVEKGQEVTKGQTIGYIGNTGKSTGPHLHYEVRLNDEKVDPMDYIE